MISKNVAAIASQVKNVCFGLRTPVQGRLLQQSNRQSVQYIDQSSRQVDLT